MAPSFWTGQGVAAEDRKVFEALHAGYDREHHTENVASHSRALDPDFLDRFAVVGPPAACVAKLAAVVAAGIERLVVIGPSRDAEPRQAARSNALFLNEVLPALRGRPTRSP
jgi:5,10-methylenetetrahydromethanopterin reductase